MSDPSNLFPNLNEIMEEFIGAKEVRAEERAEPEQSTDETRKRKRGAEEASAERIEEKASD